MMQNPKITSICYEKQVKCVKISSKVLLHAGNFQVFLYRMSVVLVLLLIIQYFLALVTVVMATAFETSHEVQRGKVCVVCYQKKAYRLVSDGDTDVIKNYVIEGYTSTNSDFPNGICISCSVSLSKKCKDPNFVIPNLVDNYDPERKTSLRSATICDCRICNMNRGKEIGLKLHHNRKNKRKRGRPTTNTTLESFKVCGKCFTK